MAKTASLVYELVHQEVFKELLFRPVCQRDCAQNIFPLPILAKGSCQDVPHDFLSSAQKVCTTSVTARWR